MLILVFKDGDISTNHGRMVMLQAHMLAGFLLDVFLPAKAWWFFFKKNTQCLFHADFSGNILHAKIIFICLQR